MNVIAILINDTSLPVIPLELSFLFFRRSFLFFKSVNADEELLEEDEFSFRISVKQN